MNTTAAPIDGVFKALSDPTRRRVIERLSRGPATVGELARPFAMALPSFTQHLKVLETCRLVESRKSGRVRTYRLSSRALESAEAWLARRRSHWEGRLDRLDAHLARMKKEECP